MKNPTHAARSNMKLKDIAARLRKVETTCKSLYGMIKRLEARTPGTTANMSAFMKSIQRGNRRLAGLGPVK
jgi:hypothetical protein